MKPGSVRMSCHMTRSIAEILHHRLHTGSRLLPVVALRKVSMFPLEPIEIIVWTSFQGGLVTTRALCINIRRQPDDEATTEVVAKRDYGRTMCYSKPPAKGFLVLDCWGLSQDFQYTLRQWSSAIRIQNVWRRAISDPSYRKCQQRLCRELSSLESTLATPACNSHRT